MNYNTRIKYKLFSDIAEIDLVEVNKTDDILSIGQFIEHCITGALTDYDGSGYFVKTINGKDYALEDIDFSINEDEVYYNGALIGSIFYFCNVFSISKIVWMNK